MVPFGFYVLHPSSMTTTSVYPGAEACRSCDGKGIVWPTRKIAAPIVGADWHLKV